MTPELLKMVKRSPGNVLMCFIFKFDNLQNEVTMYHAIYNM